MAVKAKDEEQPATKESLEACLNNEFPYFDSSFDLMERRLDALDALQLAVREKPKAFHECARVRNGPVSVSRKGKVMRYGESCSDLSLYKKFWLEGQGSKGVDKKRYYQDRFRYLTGSGNADNMTWRDGYIFDKPMSDGVEDAGSIEEAYKKLMEDLLRFYGDENHDKKQERGKQNVDY